ncbi:hypothetical protein [Candidatus Uabimicrobium sp. HlEnr_7]|uniref:hypothetical protein n=1 Tax=Candidatus Uabimicrobium helgolandensis TaxID=3095367 RepID=UPI0035569B2B
MKDKNLMGWTKIIAITIITTIIMGITVGVLGDTLNLASSIRTAIIGGTAGLTAASLITYRNK